MRSFILPTLALAASVAAQAENSYTATATSDVEKARATAKTLSPVSHIKGKAFDRLAIIWLENTDYDMAIGDRKLGNALLWFYPSIVSEARYEELKRTRLIVANDSESLVAR